MGVRAYVLARKGVLVSNPDVAKMTETQWMFEYHSLRKQESTTFKTHFAAMRQTIVSTLGLNLIRPVDDKGFPKRYDKMTEEEMDMFLPLVAWVGRAEILKEVGEQVQAELGLDKAESTDDEYEALTAAIDAAGGDMEPIIGIDPTIALNAKSARNSAQEKLLVQPLEIDGKV